MAHMTRRRFLNTSAASLGTAVAAAKIARGAPGANERVRLGVIGTGGQGRHDIMTFFKHDNDGLECPVICDVDDGEIAKAMKWFDSAGKKRPEVVKDYRKLLDRKDVDVVLIATPDHWHALQTIHACQAQKDIYCEKPLANSIGEGKAMVDWVKKTGRIVQMGTQWRMSTHWGDAVEYVHSGKLGKIRLVRAWCALAWFNNVGHHEDQPTPPGVDYDLWLGPAPKRPFNRGRFHFSFRWYWDYAGGLMTDWGVHLLNIALWAMKVDFPRRVASSGGKYAFQDDAETPDTQNTLYDFGDVGLVWEHQAGTGHGAEGREHGVAFYGLTGTLVVDANGWEVYPEGDKKGVDRIKKQREEDGELCRVRLVGNFLECCRTRQQPTMNLEVGHRVTTVAHLGNLALRTGRSIEYDAANMKVIGNDAADEMITARYRKPWVLPGI